MDFLLSGLVSYFGYTLNKNGKQNRIKQNTRKEISVNDVATFGEKGNIYNYPQATEVNGVFSNIYNNICSYENTQTNCQSFIQKEQSNIQKKINNGPMFKSGIEQLQKSPQQQNNLYISPLTGQPIRWVHNNMQPSVKKITQNIESNPNRKLESFSGVSEYKQLGKKDAVDNMAVIQPTTFFGLPLNNNLNEQRERFYISNNRNGILPFEQIMVRAPIPDNMRVKHKNVDELRSPLHKKEVYKGEFITGGGKYGIYSRPADQTLRDPKKNRIFEIGFNNAIPKGINGGGCIKPNGDYFIKKTTTINEDTNGFGVAFNSDRHNGRIPVRNADNNCEFSTVSFSGGKKMNVKEMDIFRNLSSNKTTQEHFDITNTYKNILPEQERQTTNTHFIGNPSNITKGNLVKTSDRYRTTNKEMSLFSYTGNPDREIKDLPLVCNSYKNSRPVQFLNNNNYFGPAKGIDTNGGNNKSYYEIKSNKVNLIHNRIPNSEGNKQYTPQELLNFGTKDKVVNSNRFGNFVLDSIQQPVVSIFGENTTVNEKTNISMKDLNQRIDPELLTQLGDNPYNINISSLICI